MSMTSNFLGGAPFQLLNDLIILAISSGTKFKTNLRNLHSTVNCLQPQIIQQIRLQNPQLTLPFEQIEDLQRKLDEAVVLVGQISSLSKWSIHIWGNCWGCIKPDYAGQLDELNESLRRLLETLRLQSLVQVSEVVILARTTRDRQDELGRRQCQILNNQQVIIDTLRQHQEIIERIERNGDATSDGRGEAPVQVLHLRAVFQVLYEAVTQVKVNNMMCKCLFEDFKFTLDCLKPLIVEMAEYNTVLHFPKEELENFIIQLETGVELIYKCSKVSQRASYKKSGYINKLFGLDESLQRLFNVLRLQIENDVREALVSVSNLEKQIKEIEGSDVLQHQYEVAVAEPQSPKFGLDVKNMQSTSDANDTLESARNVDVGVNRIERSSVAQNQIEVAAAEPLSPTIALDAMNMHENLDSARNVEVGLEQIVGSSVAQNQIEVAVAEPPSPTLVLDVMNMQETLNLAKNTEVGAKRLEGKGEKMTKMVREVTGDGTYTKKYVECLQDGSDVSNVQRTRDVKETLVSARNVEAATKQIEGTGVVEAPVAPIVASVAEYELPLLAVGLDVPLRGLKKKLLEDEISGLVLTGPKGCGKTTLAKKFCEDEEVRDKFKNNIFFVHVSEKANLDLVVQQLYQRKGIKLPALHDEASAVISLQWFLKQTEGHRSLLILDDVWSESESLLETFCEFRTSNYKILVTSRSEFPRFGSSCDLKSLNNEGAIPNLPQKEIEGKMVKVVMKVSITNDKTWDQTMRAISNLDGIDSSTRDQNNQEIEVVGQIDPVSLVRKLRNIVGKVEMLSVGPAKEGQKEEKEEELSVGDTNLREVTNVGMNEQVLGGKTTNRITSWAKSCDVFINFRGTDTRAAFIDHLYLALRNRGLSTFRDDPDLTIGQPISANILKAIEDSRMSVIVFSKNYASSTWCLNELVKILQCRESMQQMVMPVFYKVEPSNVRLQSGSFAEAFARHEINFKDNIRKVQTWRKALTEAANISGSHYLDRDGHESQLIDKIVLDISAVVLKATGRKGVESSVKGQLGGHGNPQGYESDWSCKHDCTSKSSGECNVTQLHIPSSTFYSVPSTDEKDSR